MMSKNLFFLISPASPKEDIFFITYGSIEKDNINTIKNYFENNKVEILLISNQVEFDWFKYFVQFEPEEFFIEDYRKNFVINFFSQKSLISNEILNLFEIKYSFLYSNLSLIKGIIEDIKINGNLIWSNEVLVTKKNTSFNNNIFFRDKFLFDFFHENYFRSCYGVKIESSNKNRYIFNDFNGYLSSDTFYFGKAEKEYTFKEHKWLGSIFSVVIEKNRNKVNEMTIINLKLIKNVSNNYYSTQLYGDKFEILRDFDVIVLCDEFEENLGRFYFVCNNDDYRVYLNLLNYIDNDFRFNWIDEHYFFDKFQNRKYNKIPNLLWSECSLFGINIRVHNFYQRYSDFGSDNDLTIFFGDSKFSKLREKKTLSVTHNPRGDSNQKNPGKYYDLNENLFEYFYEGNDYVLINFDDIPYGNGTYNCGVHNLKSLLYHKVISVPSYLIENTFVLTQDYF